MRAVVQRVKEAWVRVDGEEVARIGVGLLILVGVAADDGPEDVAFLAQQAGAPAGLCRGRTPDASFPPGPEG